MAGGCSLRPWAGGVARRPQVLAEVIDCEHSDLTIGMAVELEIRAVPAQEGGEDKLVYKWRPALA